MTFKKLIQNGMDYDDVLNADYYLMMDILLTEESVVEDKPKVMMLGDYIRNNR